MLKFVLALGVFAALNLYLALHVFKTVLPPRIALVTFGLLFGVQLIGPLGNRLIFPILREWNWSDALIRGLDWLSFLTMGALACLVIYGLFLDGLFLVGRLAQMPATPDLQRRALLGLGLVSTGTLAIGITQAMAGPQIRAVTIRLKSLPSSFDGFKIVQISDLHVGPMIGRDYTRNVVKMANGLAPDLVVLTGDFVDGPLADLRDDVAPLADLTAVHGAFYVTGNHEYYWDAPAWTAEFRRLGATVLCNTHCIIRQGDDQIVVGGIPDLSTLRSEDIDKADASKAFDGAPANSVKILLAHQPASYEMAHAAGTDLQLSGHTHAGQFFPFNLVVKLFQRYTQGLNNHDGMWVYVNRGTGFWGPPIRTGIPAEITLITLRRDDLSG